MSLKPLQLKYKYSNDCKTKVKDKAYSVSGDIKLEQLACLPKDSEGGGSF
jgi:hypothetical protein